MTNPLVEMKTFLDADAHNLPSGTTRGTSFPSTAITAPHVQYAWDGTPTDADNREDAVVRVTVWAPKRVAGNSASVDPAEAADVAAKLRARLLAWSSAGVWTVERGAGRLPGVDPDIKLPFCTFTVTFVLHAVTA